MRRGSNMVGSTWNCIMCFEIWAALKWNRFFDVSARRYKIFKFGLWSQFIQFIFIFIIGNEILERIGTDCTNKYFKFVGLKIDEFLNWDYQIEHVSNKIALFNSLAEPNRTKSYKLEWVLFKTLECFPSSLFPKLWNSIELELEETKSPNCLKEKSSKTIDMKVIYL